MITGALFIIDGSDFSDSGDKIQGDIGDRVITSIVIEGLYDGFFQALITFSSVLMVLIITDITWMVAFYSGALVGLFSFSIHMIKNKHKIFKLS